MNIKIFLLALLFGFIKNQHFGWQVMPVSTVEILCDGFMFLILALAFHGHEKKAKRFG